MIYYSKINQFKIFFFNCIILLFISTSAFAQTTINGEFMQRGEILNGYGKPSVKGLNPAGFIGQRTRLKFNHEAKDYKFYVAAQDIRTWGSTPLLKTGDGFLSIHEAWGEINLNKDFTLKVGRQELDYDDARFLGNLDWALQARSHDLALIKYKKDDLQMHAGFAYNQNTQTQLQGNFYVMPNQYKAAQYLWANKNFANFNISFLLWNNGIQMLKFNADSSRNEYINYTQTIGFPKIEYKYNNFIASGFYYQQIGKDGANINVNAYDVNIDLSYLISLSEAKSSKLKITTGYEILSGNSQTKANSNNKAFNPMFGTNHRHNGYMDYFYVGNRHINSVGLKDAYLKFKYDFSTKAFVSINTHMFQSDADILDRNNTTAITAMDKNLGYEFDFTTGYILNDAVSVQAGVSQMNASASMQMLSGNNLNNVNNWAYLMLLIRPGSKARYSGLKF